MTNANETMKSLRFGIEIETVGITRAALARAIQTAIGGTIIGGSGEAVRDPMGRDWRVVADASLSGSINGEVVSPILGYADIEQVQQVVRAIRSAGARADESCGIHVHVDGSRFDARTLTNLVRMVHKQEALIEHALKVSPRRRAQYCKPIDAAFMERLQAAKPRNIDDFRAAWYGSRGHTPSRYDRTRYHGLNLNSYLFRGSIEYRYFNGTLHAGEVKAYIQFAMAISARALDAKATSSKRRAFDAATAKYDFRVLLLGLGLIGKEFKTCRLHLTKHLGGSAAWKGERRDRRPQDAPQAPPEGEITPAPAGATEGAEEGPDSEG